MKSIWLIVMLLLGLAMSAGAEYKVSLVACAHGDTCVYYAEQAGPLDIPELTPEARTILWSTAMPMVEVVTDRPITVTEQDSTGADIEVPTGRYFHECVWCATAAFLLVDGIPTCRMQRPTGELVEYPLEKCTVFIRDRRDY